MIFILIYSAKIQKKIDTAKQKAFFFIKTVFFYKNTSMPLIWKIQTSRTWRWGWVR